MKDKESHINRQVCTYPASVDPISFLLPPILWQSIKRRENESFGNATKRTPTSIKRFIVKMCFHFVIFFLSGDVVLAVIRTT